MIETVIFVIGVVLGVCAVLAIQWVYNWIDKTYNQVQSLKWELERQHRISENWTEFLFWKNEQQSKSK